MTKEVTKVMSLRTKQRHFDEKYPPRVVRTIPKNLSMFGQTAPTIRIGCSRQEQRSINDNPGPGAYKVDTDSIDKHKSHKIQKKQQTSDKTITSDINLLPPSDFLSCNPKKIHELSGVRFFQIKPVPAPSYIPPSVFDPPRIKIGVRSSLPNQSSNVPGPGEYNPDFNTVRPRSAAFSVGNRIQKDLWIKSNDEIPGPGKYQLGNPLPPPRRWNLKYYHKNNIRI